MDPPPSWKTLQAINHQFILRKTIVLTKYKERPPPSYTAALSNEADHSSAVVEISMFVAATGKFLPAKVTTNTHFFLRRFRFDSVRKIIKCLINKIFVVMAFLILVV